jgi:PTS system nitrogen regulatory IIA component
MPYRTLNTDEVADYLHLPAWYVEKMVRAKEIPHQMRGGRAAFLRGEIDAWASQRIIELPKQNLTKYHERSTQGTRMLLEQEALIPLLMRPGFIEPALLSKTRRSVIDGMVSLAINTGRVNDPVELRESVAAREDLCPTAIEGGMALLHCRHHDPYRFEESFVLLGRTVQEIPFGAPDGRSTRFFFLLCCQEERLHLHALARFCLMAQKTDLLQRLYAATEAETLYAALETSELAALAGKKRLVEEREGEA